MPAAPPAPSCSGTRRGATWIVLRSSARSAGACSLVQLWKKEAEKERRSSPVSMGTNGRTHTHYNSSALRIRCRTTTETRTRAVGCRAAARQHVNARTGGKQSSRQEVKEPVCDLGLRRVLRQAVEEVAQGLAAVLDFGPLVRAAAFDAIGHAAYMALLF